MSFLSARFLTFTGGFNWFGFVVLLATVFFSRTWFVLFVAKYFYFQCFQHFLFLDCPPLAVFYFRPLFLPRRAGAIFIYLPDGSQVNVVSQLPFFRLLHTFTDGFYWF